MIDIRTLTPNCHAMLGNKRVKVVNIDSLNNLIGVEDYFYVAQDGTKYCIGNEPKNLDPIPITEELLMELGFEKSTDNIIGVPIFAKTIENDFHIEVKKFHGYDEWRLHVDDCDRDSVGFIDVHYLHEAEAFVYLTTKQELI